MKKIIRKQIINLLTHLPKYKKSQFSLSCIEQIIDMPEYEQSQCVAVYLANEFELDLLPLIQHAWQCDKQVVVPRCDYTTNTMYFVPFDSLDDQIKDDRNILTSRQQGIVNDIDFMVVPGLAFNEDGYRIGYGGGFYDKYLAHHPQLFTVSLAILPQIVDFEPEHFDIAVKQLIKSQYI